MNIFVAVLATLFTCREIGAFNNGDIYLSSPNGDFSSTGVVQIETNDKIGYICEDGFNNAAAAAACRQVGFVDAVDYGKAGDGEFSDYKPVGEPVLKDVRCDSYQLHILRCSNSPDIDPNCTAVVVKCENTSITKDPYNGQVQLVNEDSTSPVKSVGILKVYINDKWMEVCAADINDLAASSACRQLGYTNAASVESTTSDNPLQQLNSTCETDSEPCFFSCVKDNGVAEQCNDVAKITCTFDESNRDDLTAGFCNYSAVGAIVGGVLGGIAAVVLIGVIIIITAICFLSPSCYVYKKIKRKGYSGV